jgi:hypothetical protein
LGTGIRPREIESALNRLTAGKPWRQTKESVEWRLVVRSADNESVAIRVQVCLHRKEVAKAAFGDIARRLLIERKDIHTILADWSHEQLVEHLQRHTKDQLCEPARQRFRR